MSIHSKDGNTWLTKLERIGQISANDAEVVFNNLGHIIDADMLKEQYRGLSPKKAIGIDKVTKEAYGRDLGENINKLLQRIRRGIYKPKPARIVEIPKEDGSTRPLAISCLEDKLVQASVSQILSTIYEPRFLSCSYGFRAGKSAHDALKALSQATFKNWDGAVIEIDIRKYFNTIPHEALMTMLRSKMSDQRFVRLIEILIKAPILEEGGILQNKEGCPQGSILSPILANIYLHHAVDEWFEEVKHSHLKGSAEEVRYADDLVFCFKTMDDAKRFYEVLPKRLEKYGLEMHMEKSQLLEAGHLAAERASQNGMRLGTFNFLGFTCYWGKTKKGYWRLKYSSRKDRFTTKLKGLREYLRGNLNTRDTLGTLRVVVRVVTGWLNYHSISDNGRRVSSFIEESRKIIYRWFNRRGSKKMDWTTCGRILEEINFPRRCKTKSMFT
jgi:RNA-directed DNA polymerase